MRHNFIQSKLAIKSSTSIFPAICTASHKKSNEYYGKQSCKSLALSITSTANSGFPEVSTTGSSICYTTGAITTTGFISSIFVFTSLTATFGFSSATFAGYWTWLKNFPIKFPIYDLHLLALFTGFSSGKITVIATGYWLAFLIFKNGWAWVVLASHLSQ